jgi:hypothetical protein
VPSVVPAGPKITSWGTIKPPHTAAENRTSHTKIYFEHLIGGKWDRQPFVYAQKYVNTSTETRYSISIHYAPGYWRVYAVHQDDDHAKSVSSVRSFLAR